MRLTSLIFMITLIHEMRVVSLFMRLMMRDSWILSFMRWDSHLMNDTTLIIWAMRLTSLIFMMTLRHHSHLMNESRVSFISHLNLIFMIHIKRVSYSWVSHSDERCNSWVSLIWGIWWERWMRHTSLILMSHVPHSHERCNPWVSLIWNIWCYGVATISELLKMMGLFCKRAL